MPRAVRVDGAAIGARAEVVWLLSLLRSEARDGGDARKADAFFEAFLGAGWAATAAALAWALAALRRERRGAGAFRHAQLQLGDDDDTL